MEKKKVNFIVLFMLVILTPYVLLPQSTYMTQVLGAIGQSDLMNAYSQIIQTKIDKATTHKFLQFGDQPASLKY